VWSTLITDSCNTWGIVTFTTYGPSFLKVYECSPNACIHILPSIKKIRFDKEAPICTANEGPVRIQYKCIVSMYAFPEMKL
jgi:hypothetical protein